MWCVPWVYVSFCGEACSILGRISEASDDVWLEAEVVHSVRIVEWYAMQALEGGGKPRVSLAVRVWEGLR